MKRVVVKEEYCMNCRLCEVNCKAAHSSYPGDVLKAFLLEGDRLVARVRVEQKGYQTFPVQCRNCPRPLCVEACMGGAMSVDSTGQVIHDSAKCVGCWMCVMVCPVGAVVPVASEHVVAKCDMCKALEAPACVQGCPNEALYVEEA